MNWTVNLEAMPREEIPNVVNELRESKGGSLPDAIADLIVAEVEGLETNWTKASVVSSGHFGSGSPRHVAFNVSGAS